LLLWGVSGISPASSAALIVATAQLSVVQLLRKAIAATDAQGNGKASQSPDSTGRPSAASYSPDRLSDQSSIHAPVFSAPVAAAESRSSIYSSPKIENHSAASFVSYEPDVHKMSVAPTFQPPWDSHPWPAHQAVDQKIKPQVWESDILIKGLLIDLFI